MTGIHLSTDNVFGAGDQLLTTDAVGALSAVTGSNESATFSTSGIAPGNYYVFAVADYSNTIAETNEASNPSNAVALTVNTDQSLTFNTANSLSSGFTLGPDALLAVSPTAPVDPVEPKEITVTHALRDIAVHASSVGETTTAATNTDGAVSKVADNNISIDPGTSVIVQSEIPLEQSLAGVFKNGREGKMHVGGERDMITSD